MSSAPSGPKPTKETYLATLRILKEHQQNLAEDRSALLNSPVKSKAGHAVLCTEEVILAAEPIKAALESTKKGASAIILGSKSSSTKTLAPQTAATTTAATAAATVAATAPTTVPVVQPTPLNPVKTIILPDSPSKSVKFTGNQQSIKSPSGGGFQSGVSQKLKPGQPQAPTSPAIEEVVKLGRKANRRFTQVLTVLPNVKLDKSMKLQVATELKKMNCWSDDEGEQSDTLDTIADDSSDSDGDSIVPATAVASVKASEASVKLSGKSGKTAASVSTKVVASAPMPAAAAVGNMKSDGKSAKAPVNAYLQQQKELARAKAKETIVKKTVKIFVKLRKDEHEKLNKSQWAKNGKLAVEKAVRDKIINFRINRIMGTAFAQAVERRIKMDKKERRRQIRMDAAQRRILKAWKKFRARFLLGCVIEYIRLKARLFREQARLEDRNFRMRTAMRRVKEDGIFKEWMEEQRVHSTFPVKPHPPLEPGAAAAGVKKKAANNDVHIHVTQAFARRNHLHVFFDKETPPPQKPPLSSPRAPSTAPGAPHSAGAPASGTAGSSGLAGNGGGRPSRKQSAVTSAAAAAAVPGAANSNSDNGGSFFLTQTAEPATNSSSTAVPSNHSTGGNNNLPHSSSGNNSRAGSAAPPRSAQPPHSANSKTSSTVRTAAPVTNTAQAVVQSADYIFNRPDLAPFSTMINQLITGSMLFQAKQTQSWMDIASVSADYGETYKQKKKSPAYTALEKFCGISESDVVRSQLTSHSDSVSMKLKSFGHSIISL